jgi:hypothetical protein
MAQAIRFDLIAGVDKWNRGFRDAERTSSRFGARLRVGIASGAAAAAAGVGALAVGAFKLGESFDSAYDTIRVTTGKTGKSLAGLKKDFKAVVKDVPTDFESAATAVGKLNQRTGQTGKGLQRLAEQELELSRITKTDLGANIAASTRLFRDWSIPTRKQASTLDEMFRAAQATGIGVTDLMEKVVQFGSPLRQLGFNLDQTTALFGEFERAGVVTETVLPGLKMALKSYALAHKDPQKALIETIRRIKESSTTAQANTIAFKTFGARAGPDLAAAIREGHFDLDLLIKTISGGKDTIRAAAADTADFAEKWKVFSNRMKVLVEPAVSALFGAIGTLADKLSKNVLPAVQAFITTHGPQFKTILEGVKKAFDTIYNALADPNKGVIPNLDKLRQSWEDNKQAIIDFQDAIPGANTLLHAAGIAVQRLVEEVTGAGRIIIGLGGMAARGALAVRVALDSFGVVALRVVGFFQTMALHFVESLRTLASAADRILHTHLARSLDGAVANLKRARQDTQSQLDRLKTDGTKRAQELRDNINKATGGIKRKVVVEVRGRDLVGPVARRIRQELAAMTGVLPGQVLKSTVRGGVRREAKGGYITGPGTSTSDSIPAMLSAGEFVVNARAVRRVGVDNLRQINAMRMANGGLVDEVAALPALRIRMVALAKKLFGGSAGIKAFIRSTDSLPYIWGAAGPGGYDCSGLVSAVLGKMTGRGGGHGQRYFTTSSIHAGILGIKPGLGGTLQIGVTPSRGHMVGRYGGLGFEAESTRTGIKIGSAASRPESFARHYHLAKGGMVDLKELLRAGVAIGGDPGKLRVDRFDRGGFLPPGLSMAYNGTGRPEPVGINYDRLAAALVKALHAAPPRVAVDDIHTGLLRKKNAWTGGMSLGLS